VGVSVPARRPRLREGPQVGGFATRAEAEKALRKVIDRLGPGGGRATITLAEFVEEYLEMHQASPITISKLRWLLGKATAKLGETRLADLSPRDVYAWRMTVPEGHRFEATQALRQVLNRAVGWRLLDYNPAKLGVPNPPRRPKEMRPFDTWRQIEAVAAQLGPVYGPMIIFAAATGLSRRRLRPPRLCQRSPQAHEHAAEHAGGPAAGEGAGGARPAAGLGQPDPVSEHARWTDRLPDLRS